MVIAGQQLWFPDPFPIPPRPVVSDVSSSLHPPPVSGSPNRSPVWAGVAEALPQLAQQVLEVARRRGETSTVAHAETFLASLGETQSRAVLRSAPENIHALSAQLTSALRRYPTPSGG